MCTSTSTGTHGAFFWYIDAYIAPSAAARWVHFVVNISNLILINTYDELADINEDSLVDILDIMLLVNWIIDNWSVYGVYLFNQWNIALWVNLIYFEIYILL